MQGRRTLTRIGLVLAGTLLTLYFLGVVFLTDCSAACVRGGEQAPGFAFVGVGVFVATLGLTWSPKRSTLAAAGAALFVAALVALVGTMWVYARGGRGSLVWVMLAIATLDLLVGGWLAFWRR